MGTWGEKLLDNDDAGDLEVTWDEWISEGRTRDPEFWSPERIADFLKVAYFREGFDRAVEDSDELLAVGALFLRDGLEPPAELRDALIRAANIALRPDRLKEWEGAPRSRKKVLEGPASSLLRSCPAAGGDRQAFAV